MNNERENNSSINLTASSGIPTVSFVAAGGAGAKLIPELFHIVDNNFTAYYDGAHKLVFVLDNTLDVRKPNVLLVINPVGDRKWDDILANDHGVDLETVRPKVDNKYQKLDIEYSGLSIYNTLINEFKAGSDLTAALGGLSDFRTATVRRAAADRLDAAKESITKTRETISKTGETMRELQAYLKKLREKFSKQKKEVGKEPTKQSAAKILKTESQIDATNEKLHRAKRRLTNAQRRLAATEEDADIARRILNQKEQTVNVPAVPAKQEIVEYKEITKEPKAEDMAEEKVKPLFDKDPEFLDEKIAFKPIDFSMPSVIASEPVVQPEAPVLQEEIRIEETVTPPAPLSFVPPVMNANRTMPASTPVVDTVVPVASVITNVPTNAPVLDTITSVSVPEPVVEEVIQTAPGSAPVIEPAPISSGDRPVSPISGPVAHISNTRSKPTALYYIMLVVLIVLSVVTLWLYQRNTATNVPDLTAPTKTEVVAEVSAPSPAVIQSESVNSPFIQAELNQQPELLPIAAPQPMPVVDAEPVMEQPAVDVMVETDVITEPEPIVYDDVPSIPVSSESDIAEPVYQAAEVVSQAVVSAPQPQVAKPAYNVSQQDKMFVASSDYETDEAVYYEDAGYEPQPVADTDMVNDYYE